MNKLKELREKRGLTQRQMATVMGITQASYWSLEKEKTLLNSRQIIMLSNFFQCSPNDILDFKSQYHIIIGEVFHE